MVHNLLLKSCFLLSLFLITSCDNEKELNLLNRKYNIELYLNEQGEASGASMQSTYEFLEFIRNRDHVEIVEKFESHLKKKPYEGHIYLLYIQYLYNQDKLNKAFKVTQEAIKAFPKHPEVKIYNHWLSQIVRSGAINSELKDQLDKELRLYQDYLRRNTKLKMKSKLGR